MKKILMSLVLIGTFAALSAKAVDSYLYWMVEEGTSTEFAYANAILYAKNINVEGDPTPIGGMQVDYEGSVMESINLAANVGPGWSYYVELIASDGWMMAKSDPVNWTANMVGMYTQMQTGGTPANAVRFTNFTPGPIPEPTSGLLVLLGVCGLALKRKRV